MRDQHTIGNNSTSPYSSQGSGTNAYFMRLVKYMFGFAGTCQSQFGWSPNLGFVTIFGLDLHTIS